MNSSKKKYLTFDIEVPNSTDSTAVDDYSFPAAAVSRSPSASVALRLPDAGGRAQLEPFLLELDRAKKLASSLSANLRIGNWEAVTARKSYQLIHAIFCALAGYPHKVAICSSDGEEKITDSQIKTYYDILPDNLIDLPSHEDNAPFDLWAYVVRMKNDQISRSLSGRRKALINYFYDADKVHSIRCIYSLSAFGNGKLPMRKIVDILASMGVHQTPSGANLTDTNLPKVINSYRDILNACQPSSAFNNSMRAAFRSLNPTARLHLTLKTEGGTDLNIPSLLFAAGKVDTKAEPVSAPLEISMERPDDSINSLQTVFVVRLRQGATIEGNKRFLLKVLDIKSLVNEPDKQPEDCFLAIIEGNLLTDGNEVQIDLSKGPGILPGYYVYQLIDVDSLPRLTSAEGCDVVYDQIQDFIQLGYDLFDPEDEDIKLPFSVYRTGAGEMDYREESLSNESVWLPMSLISPKL